MDSESDFQILQCMTIPMVYIYCLYLSLDT